MHLPKFSFLVACLTLLVANVFSPSTAHALEGFPAFRFDRVVIEPADMVYNPTNEFNVPTIIKASDHFANPLGTYYLYYAPHENPGGICLAYSDSLEGPWIEHPGNPVISNVWAPYYSVPHVSSPHAFWNSEVGRLYLYFHGDNATTRAASSTDGINFTYEKICVTKSDFYNATEASYARVFEHALPSVGNKYIMLLMGVEGANPGTRKIYLAWSNDCLNWTPRFTAVVAPDSTEAGQIAGPHFFPWNGKYHVIYHSSTGNMHVTEVGADFNLENHLGVFHDSMPMLPDDSRSASPCFYADGGTLYMFYDAGQRNGTRIALAKSTATAGLPPPWNLLNDDLNDYAAGWGSIESSGFAVQNSGSVRIVDNVANGVGPNYFYLGNYAWWSTPAVGPFTFELRARVNAPDTLNEITLGSGPYKVSLFLTHGTSGKAQNKSNAPSRTFTLDTTVYHTYRVVVHANYTYDLYVDGALVWALAPNLGTSSNLFKIGSDASHIADLEVDYARVGSGELLPGSPPATPTGLTVTDTTTDRIDLAWSASTGAASYNVKRAPNSGGPHSTIASGVMATSYSDTGLPAATTYYYVVSAVNASGESLNSNEVSGTTGFPPSSWNLINDNLSDYAAGWTASGTAGSITQNSGYVTITDTASTGGGYHYMTRSSYTAPTAPFTFETRAKANASGTKNEFTLRSGAYKVSLYLTHGTAGTAQNKETGPTRTYTLDTTVYHTYRVVVHADHTYDLYVDGALAWSGAPNLGTGSAILKIGGDNTPLANVDVDDVKLGTGEILP